MIDIHSYAFGNGSHNFNCEKGPSVLKNAIDKTNAVNQYQFQALLTAHNHQQQRNALMDIAALSEKLALSTQQSVSDHRLFITMGGDHTAAIGSWSGAANAISGDLGLIWFDAHMDSHTFETTPSNNIHGMPLAILLGHGAKELTEVLLPPPKLKPENVVLIGVRSYESGEAQLLKKLGVKIFYMDDIKKLGMHKVVQESVAIVTHNTNGFGISIDLDGFDPIDAPGVGSPEPDGIRADDFLPEFKAIVAHPKFIGADIVEFNPMLDQNQKTERLAVKLCEEMIKTCE